MEARRATGWWYAALGAGAVSLGVILVAHGWFSAGQWLRGGSLPGYTIYPPLAAASAESVSFDPLFAWLGYRGLLLAAVIALAISGFCWLVSVARSWGAGARPPGHWLPVLLALPAAVHAGAYEYHLRYPAQELAAQAMPRQLPNFDSLRAVVRVADSLAAAGDPAEAAAADE